MSYYQINQIYVEEAELLNMALFGMTSKKWKALNPTLKGNLRDYASVEELICLGNLENINSVLISEGFNQSIRLEKLNNIAITQMKILCSHKKIQLNEKNHK